MVVKVLVDASLKVRLDQIGPEAGGELEAAFTHVNPSHAKLARINRRAAWGEPAHIRTYTLAREDDGVWMCMPRGGAARLRSVLRAAGHEWKFEDARTMGAEALRGKIPEHHPLGLGKPGALWAHQERIVEAAVRRENCLVRAPTGSGKTTAAIAFIARVQVPTLVIVWNSALLTQWVRRLQVELGLAEWQIGHVQGSSFKLGPITLAMQQTLWRMSEDRWRTLDATFGAIVCDEVQRFAAVTFLKVIRRFSARYRLGISADETRKDQKEFLIYDEFGGVEAAIDQRALEASGVVHDVQVRVIPTQFTAEWYVEQRRKASEAARTGQESKPPNYKLLLDKMVENEARSELAMDAALAEVRGGQQVIVLSERVEHCRRFDAMAVAAGVPSGSMVGDMDEEREATIKGLVAGRVRMAAGTIQAIGQGLDFPAVARGVVVTPLATNRQLWGQVRGRICRTTAGKVDAVVYYLWDRLVFGKRHLQNLKAWNRQVTVWHRGRWCEAATYLKEEAV